MTQEIEITEEFIKQMDKFREPDKTGGLIEACSKNVVVFADKMLGFKLYSWQVYFLNEIQKAMIKDPLGKIDLQKEFCAITSRQIGKSTAIAILSIWSSIFNKYPGTLSNNTSVLISSASDVQAKKLLYEMKKLLKMGDRYMTDTYKDENGEGLFGKEFFSALLDDNEPNNTTTITFRPHDPELHGPLLLAGSKSGSTIKSYPPTSSVLGETASVVIIDEAGKSEKISDQFFYDYLSPTGNSTDAVRIYTSTPWVSSGFFYRMVDPDGNYGNSPAAVVLFTVDAIKIENPKYYQTVMKTVDQLNKDGKTDEVQRAYYCRFVKGETSYFNPEKVVNAFTNEYQPTESYRGPCDMGVDFGGQTISRSVITITECDEEGMVRRLYHRTYAVGKDNTLIEDIANLQKDFNIQRIIVDDCPQGDYLTRQMIEKGWNLTLMNFRQDKVKKYGAFRATLNRGKIQSYNDDELKTEMLALEFGQGSRNSIIQHAPGYTDDLIDSFLMSTYFYVQEEGGVEFYDWIPQEVDKTIGGRSRLSRRESTQPYETPF